MSKNTEKMKKAGLKEFTVSEVFILSLFRRMYHEKTMSEGALKHLIMEFGRLHDDLGKAEDGDTATQLVVMMAAIIDLEGVMKTVLHDMPGRGMSPKDKERSGKDG